MGRSILSLFLMTAIVGGAFSFPAQSDKYKNIPQCMQPSESGLCLAYFPSWFYNPSSGDCETFVYGGCQGNDNRFVSREACMAQCGNFKLENKEFKLNLESDEAQPAFEKLVENDDKQTENNEGVSVCKLPSETGPCRGMMNRFYFNGNKCEVFIYGGCQGNENNFKTLEECQQKCESISGNESSSNSEEQTESKVNDEVASSSEEKE